MFGHDYNRQNAASSLPTEILCSIFFYLQTIDCPFSRPQGSKCPSTCAHATGTASDSSSSINFLGWKNVTHVCKRWREAALGYPLLWSSFCPTNLGPSWAQKTLERSAKTKLDLVLNFDWDWDVKNSDPAPVLRYWLEEPRRERFHRLSLVYAPSYEHLDSFMNVDFPRLESLTILVDQTDGAVGVKKVNRVQLSKENMPKLSKLALYNITAPWTPSLFSNLTELTLYMKRTEIHYPPTAQELQSILEAMKRIRKLFLVDVFEFEGEGELHVYPELLPTVVTLPECLETAVFGNSFSNAALPILLASLNFHESTYVEVQISISESGTRWKTMLVNSLARITGSPCALSFISTGDSGTVSLNLYRNGASRFVEDPILFLDEPGNPSVRIRMTSNPERAYLGKFVQRLFTKLELSSLVALEIQTNGLHIAREVFFNRAPRHAAGKSLFESAVNVRVLAVTDYDDYSNGSLFRHIAKQIVVVDIQAEDDFCRKIVVHETDDVYFPKLDTLILGNRIYGHYTKSALPFLKPYFDARIELQCPVSSVHLSISNCKESMIAKLKELPTAVHTWWRDED